MVSEFYVFVQTQKTKQKWDVYLNSEIIRKVYNIWRKLATAQHSSQIFKEPFCLI